MLVQVWQYEFVVRTAGGGFVIVLKHGVDMIEPAKPEAMPAGSP
jgi:hypothetical protein